MKPKFGMNRAGVGMENHPKSMGPKPVKQRETVSNENKAAFHAAVMGLRAEDLPKKKK